MNTHRDDKPGKIIGDPAAAQQHDTADFLLVAAEETEEFRDGQHVAGYKNLVPGFDFKIARRDQDFTVPVNHRIQDAGKARHFGSQVFHGNSHHRIRFLRAEFHHFDLPLGE